MNHPLEKGELRTVVINSLDKLNGSTNSNAKYGVDWDNILGSGRYKLHWKYIETDIVAVPNAPTNVVATTTGTTTASISFTPPSGTILDYTVISSPATSPIVGLSSPITFTGLSPNTLYTFTMTARNAGGSSVPSTASNQITTISNPPTIGTATSTGTTTATVAFTPPVGGNGTITSYTATSRSEERRVGKECVP